MIKRRCVMSFHYLRKWTIRKSWWSDRYFATCLNFSMVKQKKHEQIFNVNWTCLTGRNMKFQQRSVPETYWIDQTLAKNSTRYQKKIFWNIAILQVLFDWVKKNNYGIEFQKSEKLTSIQNFDKVVEYQIENNSETFFLIDNRYQKSKHTFAISCDFAIHTDRSSFAGRLVLFYRKNEAVFTSFSLVFNRFLYSCHAVFI